MKNRTTAPYIALTVMLLAGYPSIANASWFTNAFHSVSHAVTGVANTVADQATIAAKEAAEEADKIAKSKAVKAATKLAAEQAKVAAQEATKEADKIANNKAVKAAAKEVAKNKVVQAAAKEAHKLGLDSCEGLLNLAARRVVGKACTAAVLAYGAECQVAADGVSPEIGIPACSAATVAMSVGGCVAASQGTKKFTQSYADEHIGQVCNNF